MLTIVQRESLYLIFLNKFYSWAFPNKLNAKFLGTSIYSDVLKSFLYKI